MSGDVPPKSILKKSSVAVRFLAATSARINEEGEQIELSNLEARAPDHAQDVEEEGVHAFRDRVTR